MLCVIMCATRRVGKSTFLRVLSGELPLQGGAVRLGETVRVGYYSQQGLSLTSEEEALPVLRFVQLAVDKGMAARWVGGQLQGQQSGDIMTGGGGGDSGSSGGSSVGIGESVPQILVEKGMLYLLSASTSAESFISCNIRCRCGVRCPDGAL